MGIFLKFGVVPVKNPVHTSTVDFAVIALPAIAVYVSTM